MSSRVIFEAKGKELLNKYVLTNNTPDHNLIASISTPECDFNALAKNQPWLLTERLVVKPDQMIKRRGKLGLIKLDTNYKDACDWILDLTSKELQIGNSKGYCNYFIIEKFFPHKEEDEMYVCICSHRNGDYLMFCPRGGIDVGDVDSKALKMDIPIETFPTASEIEKKLLQDISPKKRPTLALFLETLFKFYSDLYFTYLEINPLVMKSEDNSICALDVAAKIDTCAEYLCKAKWGEMTYPPPFGRRAYPEEEYIRDLDAKSGASLKLTILNPNGRIWTMVAGGGASVIYSDTICDLGGADDLANYGEYSGAPSESQTYEYAKTVLSLMTRNPREGGKVLIIGGGIANFTNVASTFKGIVRALTEFHSDLCKVSAKIYVRRAGPNYQEGLRIMKNLGKTLKGVPIYVYGPETHMTAIVGMALGVTDIAPEPLPSETTANFLLSSGMKNGPELGISNTCPGSLGKENISNVSVAGDCASKKKEKQSSSVMPNHVHIIQAKEDYLLFTKNTRSIIWGLQLRAVQSMLDFDYSCSRINPSVSAMVYPFTGDHSAKFYWGHKEILIPVYAKMEDAMKKHPDTDVLINFASLRSAYESTLECMKYPQIRTIAIIAEGIPENLTKSLIAHALKLKSKERSAVTLIGPATVGAIKPACFKIGNTGGMLDNVLASKLYRPGSVAYVSRSGGMSNELNNILSRNSDGAYEGVAIGGDRYPGTTFLDHLIRFQADPDVKMMVVLGEVGGVEEYRICDALKNKKLTKPLVAWCIGTCANKFNSDVQFGHAGSMAEAEAETATAKNRALKECGAITPSSFDTLGEVIRETFQSLVKEGKIEIRKETAPPTVPMDYDWACELGLIRKPASFMTSICDERGQELLYAGMPITRIFEQGLGIGDVISLLWFQRRLPYHAARFIEMCLILTADHGPAVSGAHNTIVCARAGKDLVSCLASGLLTIGDRFGGALDAAAKQFSQAYYDQRMIAMEFVNSTRKEGKLIMGIGHRVKSKPNLILNVDGAIGVIFVDILRHSGCFTPEEARDYVEYGALNGIFVLGRSMGFIGHYLDQKRLKQGLYRHPWDDISYVMPEISHENFNASNLA
ncbi:ATP-citrate synthase-like isoform X2 [Gordionus sp. m RMFG-2023]|uniref:ATP-citrate synthase-like isoform X2 n=1 Tax=Gordionus sp. m RMFG-2023 TaxID=3053472 RepID=UPI0031FDB91B